MNMQAMKKQVYQLMAALGASLTVMSCGGNGASNNDQGMSVTFLGLFNSNRLTTNTTNIGGGAVGLTPGQLGCGQLPAGIIGAYIQLGEIGPEPGGTLTSSNLAGTDPAGAFVAVVGIQNNLYGQAFRAERLLMDFYIPGASEQPPSTNVPISLIAGPAESAQNSVGVINNQNNQNQSAGPGLRRPIFTSLPPSFSNLCNRALSQATIVPASIREWLNFNRDLLPPAPFKMEVVLRVSGLSSSGNRIETNDVVLDVDVLPETYVDGGGDADFTPTPAPTAAGVDAVGSGSDGFDQLGEE